MTPGRWNFTTEHLRGLWRARDAKPPVLGHQVVPGRLALTVHEQTFMTRQGPVRCLTFVSRGLKRLGQKEIMLSVAQETPHRPIEVTDDVVAFYRMLYQRASERHFVDVGLFTTSGAEALLPLAPPRWRGIVYTFAEPLVDATPAPDALAAVPLTQDELYVGVKFGAVRILSMLGNHYRRFPTAAWLDPHRPSVVSPGDMQASLLGSMGRITLAGGWIYSRGIEVRRDVRPSTGALENAAVGFARQAIVFELSTFRATEIAQVLTQVGPSGPVALIGAPDRQADACFCWVPGHSAPYAITGPEATATRIAANHLAIVAEQDADSAAYLEDGFALLLTNRTWEELCHRLQAGPQNWVMPLRGPLGFRLKTIVT